MTINTPEAPTQVVVGPITTDRSESGSRYFPWVVLALTFGLLLSDYMSRQVLAAVFPLLKSEWGLNDAQLGTLTGIVSISVGVLAVPLSILGDRFGRVRAILAMGVLWSLATLGCAVAASYGELLTARVLLGVGEAAFGSVGLAVVLAVFPPRRRAALTGTFMAGGVFGAVFGVAFGGIVADRFGWREAFVAMAVLGAVLVVLYRMVISDSRLEKHRYVDPVDEGVAPERPQFRTLFSTSAVLLAYTASGIQLFVAGSLYGWLPTYLFRFYGLSLGRAAIDAAGFFILMGAGMIVCGALTDRVSQIAPIRKWTTSIAYSAITLVSLGVAVAQPAGTLQLVLFGVGGFFCAGIAGPAGAMVANLTPEPIRATAFGTLTLANNMLGLAAGPIVMGILSDHLGLQSAFVALPIASGIAIILLAMGRVRYPGSLAKVRAATSGVMR